MQQANTLILFCDQHNPFVSGCYGNENAHTPNIDRLAERGTVFENAYTPNPICVQMILNGHFPDNGFP